MMPAGQSQRHAPGFSACGNDRQHRPHTHGHQRSGVQPDRHSLWYSGRRGDPLHVTYSP